MLEKRLSVTHNGFLEIFCEAPQQTLTQRIVQTLEDHELVRKLIPEGAGSLMKAISDQLYFSSLRDQEIQDKCIAHAKMLIDSKTLPNKLKALKTIFEQYKQEPSNLMFDTINLELVSMVYNVRVVVYSMSKELVLKSLLFNNRCSKTIQIINMSNHYDSIYSESDLHKHTVCQNILYEILNNSELNLGVQLESDLINIDYENYLEDITRGASPDQEDDEITQEFRRKHKRSLSDTFNQLQQLSEVQANNQAGYNLFDNSMPPEIFNVILDKERRNSIVEYVRHKKSTICNSTNLSSQNQPSPLLKEGEKDQPVPKKKGVGVSLNAVKNRIVGSTDSERSSDSDDDEDHNTPKPIMGNKVESIISQASNSNGLAINIIQDEDYNLIKEAIDYKRSRQESAASYNGGNMSNSSLSNQASFQAFSAQNLTLPQQTMKHSNSNPLIHYPGSRPHSPGNTNDPDQLFGGSQNNKLGGFNNQQQQQIQQQIQVPQSQHHHPQGVYSMTDLQPQGSNTLQQPANTSISYSNSSSPPPGVDAQGNYINQAAIAKRKHQVIESSKEKFKGTLKFFDQDKNYGFIVEDDTRQDIFVHYDDLQKAGIHKGCLIDHKHSKQIRFQFSTMDYIGKYQKSTKAVELQLLSDTPPYLPMNPNQLRVLATDQYLTYPTYYTGPGGPVIHSPTSASQGAELGGQANYFSSPYGANYINHTLMPPGANHMMPMQPPLSPTGQTAPQFPPVIHYGLNVPPQQVVSGQYQNVQVSPPQIAMHHPSSPQMHQAPYPVQQPPQQAQQQLYYNNQQQPQQNAQLPYQNLVI